MSITARKRKLKADAFELNKVDLLRKAVRMNHMERLKELMSLITHDQLLSCAAHIILHIPDGMEAFSVICAMYSTKTFDVNNSGSNVCPPLYYALQKYEDEPNESRWKLVTFLIYRTKTYVAYEALEYLASLGTYTCQRAERICKCVIAASDDAIITSLRMSHFMRKIGNKSYAEQGDFLNVAASFEVAAKLLFDDIESDHLAAIFLEEPDELADTPLGVAIETKSKDFLASPRVQRILNSMWSTPNFLNETRMHTTNSILPLRATYAMLSNPRGFFFSAVGAYITKYLVHLIFLIIFSVVIMKRVPVSDNIDGWEIALWSFSITEFFGEILQMKRNGFSDYFRDTWNILDLLIIVSVTCAAGLRINADTNMIDINETSGYVLVYQALMSISAIFIWGRVFSAFIMHPTVGPLLKMVVEMMVDIKNFTYLLIIFIFAFAQAMYFFVGGHMEGYENGAKSLLSVFRSGVLGDFNLDGVLDISHNERRYVTEFIYITYVALSVIVLFNLIVAMMATTYSKVEEDIGKEYLFMRSHMIYEFESQGNQVIAPLNVIAEIAYMIYMFISTFCGCLLSEEQRKEIQEGHLRENHFYKREKTMKNAGKILPDDQIGHVHLDEDGPLRSYWHCSFCHHYNTATSKQVKHILLKWLKHVKIDIHKPSIQKRLQHMPVVCVECKRVKSPVSSYDAFVREKCSVYVFIIFLYPILCTIVSGFYFITSSIRSLNERIEDGYEEKKRRKTQRRRAEALNGGFEVLDLTSDQATKLTTRGGTYLPFGLANAEEREDMGLPVSDEKYSAEEYQEFITKRLEHADAIYHESYEPLEGEMLQEILEHVQSKDDDDDNDEKKEKRKEKKNKKKKQKKQLNDDKDNSDIEMDEQTNTISKPHHHQQHHKMIPNTPGSAPINFEEDHSTTKDDHIKLDNFENKKKKLHGSKKKRKKDKKLKKKKSKRKHSTSSDSSSTPSTRLEKVESDISSGWD